MCVCDVNTCVCIVSSKKPFLLLLLLLLLFLHPTVLLSPSLPLITSSFSLSYLVVGTPTDTLIESMMKN